MGFTPVKIRAGEELTSELEEILRENARICRGDILTMTTVAGSGHPGGSLSSIDFLVLLYAIKDFQDEVYVSHGHISPAVYSILGRYGYFPIDMVLANFRRAGSIFEGHVEKSVPGVYWDFGCLGQGLSVATAAAFSKKVKSSEGIVYVLMGDGEQEKGQIYEAATNASSLYEKGKLGKLIAYIDNNNLQITGRVDNITVNKLPESYKAWGWNVFEVDGHNFRELYHALTSSLNSEGPSVIIGKTVMGKGVSFMEGKEKYHGKPLSPQEYAEAMEELGLENNLEYYLSLRKKSLPKEPKQDVRPKRISIETGESRDYFEAFPNRKAYGLALEDLASLNPGKIFGVDCDLGPSTNLSKIGEDNFIQLGIKETHAAAFAGRLSFDYVVFFSTFVVFALDEVYNQMRLNMINRSNLKIVATHAGISVGEDGKTHHGTDYLSLARGLPTLKVIVPVDANQTDRVIRYIAKERGNFFVALPRTKTDVVLDEKGEPYFGGSYNFRYGRDDWVRDGKDAVIISLGYMTQEALKASELLEEKGYSVAVLAKSAPFAFDEETMSKVASFGDVFTLEDHMVRNGFGFEVASYFGRKGISVNLHSFGVKGYVCSGPAEDLYKSQGLDARSVAEKISSYLG